MARQAVAVRYSSIAPTLAARATERSRSIERYATRLPRPNVQAERPAATIGRQREGTCRRVRSSERLGHIGLRKLPNRTLHNAAGMKLFEHAFGFTPLVPLSLKMLQEFGTSHSSLAI